MLSALLQQFTIDTLHSHEETGLKVTYDRDKAVADFCRDQHITWQEHQSNGVIRRLHFHISTNYPAPIVDIVQTGRETRVKPCQPRKTEAGRQNRNAF